MNAVLMPDEPVVTPPAARPHVTVRGLSKSFSGKPLYTDFNLDLPRNKIWIFPTTRPNELMVNATRLSGITKYGPAALALADRKSI